MLTCTQQAHAKQVEQEYLRQVHAITKEDRKATDVLADGVIVGLGIIQQAQEDKKKSWDLLDKKLRKYLKEARCLLPLEFPLAMSVWLF